MLVIYINLKPEKCFSQIKSSLTFEARKIMIESFVCTQISIIALQFGILRVRKQLKSGKCKKSAKILIGQLHSYEVLTKLFLQLINQFVLLHLRVLIGSQLFSQQAQSNMPRKFMPVKPKQRQKLDTLANKPTRDTFMQKYVEQKMA